MRKKAIKILSLLAIFINFLPSQTTLFKFANNKVYLVNPYWTVSLREKMGTGFQVGYTTTGDSGSIRYNNGDFQYYNGSSWQTVGTGGLSTSFTKQQIDTVGTIVSGVWQGSSIDTTYTNAVSKITSVTSLLTATKQAKDYRFNLDTLTRNLSLATDNDRIRDSIAHVASINAAIQRVQDTLNIKKDKSDSTTTTGYARNWNTAKTTESNIFNDNTTQSMNAVNISQRRFRLDSMSNRLSDVIHQGYATDGVRNYFFATTKIYKYDSNFNRVDSNASPFDSIPPTVDHIGDGFYYNGKLYVPIERFGVVPSTNHYIAVYDTTAGLPFSAYHNVDAYMYGSEIGCLEIVGNIIYAGHYDNPNKLTRFNLNTFAMIDTLILQRPILHIQGLAMKNGLLYASSDDVIDNLFGVDTSTGMADVVHTVGFAGIGVATEGMDFTQNQLRWLIDSAGSFGQRLYYYSPDSTGTGLRISKFGTTEIGSFPDSVWLLNYYGRFNFVNGELVPNRIIVTKSVEPLMLASYASNTAFAGSITGERYLGTYTSPTAVTSGTIIAGMYGKAYNGSNLSGNIGSIRIVANGNITSSSAPTRIDFAVTENNALSRTVAMVLDRPNATNRLTIGGTAGTAAGTVLADTAIMDNLLRSKDSIIADNAMRWGTSTPGKLNNNGSVTAKNLSQFDSIQVQKMNFVGTIPSQRAGEIYWDSTARAFKGWEYIVLRSFDMTHGIITADVVDTNSLSETTLYTALQGANFPSVGKAVKIELYGDYTTTGGGAKTLIFRIKKGTTVIDSTIVTTGADGSTTQAWELREIFTYRAIGASGLIQSAVIVRSENTDYKGSKSTSINTTTDNTITVTVQISATGANYCYLRQGLTHTYD